MTRTPSQTPTITPTPTPPPTATITRTPTPTLPISAGPQITFFGIATAFNTVPTPDEFDQQGNPIYIRPSGAGFFIVVEARPGSSNSPPGNKTSNIVAGNPSARPDLQIEASRDLGVGSGKGSLAVCDIAGPGVAEPPGGVPGFDPFNFDPQSQMVADALNDIGCRFDVHDNSPASGSQPCTNNDKGNPAFKEAASTLQYCTVGVVGVEWEFPTGDTTVIAQVRDFAGNIGFSRKIVIRAP